MLVRGGIWGIVLAVAAVGEYVMDVLPNTPSRTQALGSGSGRQWGVRGVDDRDHVLWLGTSRHVGIAGAVIGAYAGHAARL